MISIKNIILIGQMGAGKDEVAKLLPTHKRLAFGDKIREVAMVLREQGIVEAGRILIDLFGDIPYDIGLQLLNFYAYPQPDKKDRRLLQNLGTWAKNIKQDIWTKPVRDQIQPNQNYVITDCRRLDEFEKFPDFYPVYVFASEETRLKRLQARDGSFDPADLNHEAEKEIGNLVTKCKNVIVNESTPEQLALEVRFMLDRINAEKD